MTFATASPRSWRTARGLLRNFDGVDRSEIHPAVIRRSGFIAASAAALVAGAFAPARAFGVLGQLDHSFWIQTDAEPLKAAFRRLGFSLTPIPKKQVDGSLSTFALFGDAGHTYLEIVEDRSPDGKTWTEQGTNPAAAGSWVPDLEATAAALSQRNIKLKVDKGAGFMAASFPDQSVLSNIFYYSYHRDNSPAAKRRRKLTMEPYSHHANGAQGLREIWLGVPDLTLAVSRFIAAGFPIVADAVSIEPLGARGTALGWGEHRIVLVTPTGPTSEIGYVSRYGARPVGVRVAADMNLARRYIGSSATAWGDALFVGPHQLFGGALAFSREGTWT